MLSLAALAAAMNQGLALVDRWKDKPPAGEVAREAATLYVRKSDCDRLHGDMERKLGAMQTIRESDARDGAASRRLIHDEIKQLERVNAERIAALSREMGDMERRIMSADEVRTKELHQRLNDILAEVGELRGEMHAPRAHS